jgi:hypothetical protein
MNSGAIFGTALLVTGLIGLGLNNPGPEELTASLVAQANQTAAAIHPGEDRPFEQLGITAGATMLKSGMRRDNYGIASVISVSVHGKSREVLGIAGRFYPL